MKTVLITGISRGIGKALAEKFLTEGWYVIGTSLTGTVDFKNEQLKVLKLDLSKPDLIDRFSNDLSRTLKEAGLSLNIIINNAGTLEDEDETSVKIEKLKKTLEVNLIGTIDLTERVIPFIEKDGHIISISSSAGSLGGKSETDIEFVKSSHFPYHYPAYKISKCALNMYTRTLAARLHHEGTDIRVSSVHPGWVRTDMGGDEAPVLPSEAAEQIYELATSKPETGQFWFNGKKFPW